VRAAYGDATGHIFLVSAGIGLVGLVAALLLKPVTLRSTLDLETTGPAGPAGGAAVAARDGADGGEVAGLAGGDQSRDYVAQVPSSTR
jgi:hypothetical protein